MSAENISSIRPPRTFYSWEKASSATPVWEIQQDQSVLAPRTTKVTNHVVNGNSRRLRENQVDDLMKNETPLDCKCGAGDIVTHACCKDLKGDDERHLINPDVVRDIIVGLSDGLTVPFALTAGLSSIGSSRLVVTAGLAELLAGALSMGLGGFLASQAELDHFRYLQRQTHARVLRSCSGQMEREVHSILSPFGVKESLSRILAEQLGVLESDIEGDSSTVSAGTSTGPQSEPKRSWRPWRRENNRAVASRDTDVGLTAFLLKLGEGIEAVPISRLWISALTIGMSYFLGGLVPLIPYMAHTNTRTALIVSACVTGGILLIFGAFKTYFTGAKGGVKGYLYGATSTFFVGGLGAGAAYGLVRAMNVHGA